MERTAVEKGESSGDLAVAQGLRVLGFCDWYTPEASGGAERATWEVYRRLGSAGSRVYVISASHGRPHADPGVDVEAVRGLDLSRILGAYAAPAPGAFPAGRRALSLHRPHVLHASTIHYTGCVAAAWLSQRSGVPLVVTAQLGTLDHLPRRARLPGNLWERTAGRYILRRAARVLAVSEAVRDHVIDLGARPERVTIAPNGVDHARFGIRSLDPGDEPTVMAVGRLTENKGPDLLIEAAGRLAAEGPRFDVVFVGDGPMRAPLETRARELGLGRVRFTGQVSAVEEWLRKAEIVVRSSYSEGLPLAVLEAMAAGRCNVVSDIPPNRELIEDGVSGLVFRCGDAADLARALRRVIVDPEERARLAGAAQRASAAYTWDRMAALHASAFAEVAGAASDS
ncbi:MAG: glycosyltransferase family 4 protein [Thermoleophilaceae bacterium]